MNPRSRQLSPFTLLWLLLTLGLLGPQAGSAAGPGEKRSLEDFDHRRPPTVRVVPAARGLAAAELRARLRGVRVEADGLTDAPQYVGATDGFLSGPAGEGGAIPAGRARTALAGEAHRELKTFLDEYRGLFGHGAEALETALLKRDYTNAHNGLRSVVWQQQVDGVPVFDAVLQAHVTKRGELVNVASHFLADPALAATLGTPRRAALVAAPAVSAVQAVAIAGRNIGEAVQAAEITPEDAVQGAERKQSFSGGALRGASTRLTWLPLDKASARLCWEVVLTGRTSGEMFRVLVDAETGEAQLRRCLTNYISDASYRVFTGDSPTPFQPGHASPSTAQPAQVARPLVTISALNLTASPNGWINDGVNETRGNNVDAHLDLNADDVADTPRPQGSPNRVFDFPLDLTQAPSTYRNAAVTQLFYWCNWMHDKLYELGFTEPAGNFQLNNFSRGGAGNDAVQADAQDGSGTNNANFSTPGDGGAGRMQMYVFTGPTPDRDGDFDAPIVLHEYTHGLSNRLVGGGVGISATATAGMGEGWSDFYGLALLSKPYDNVNGNYVEGGYATLQFSGLTENYYYGIRRYPYSTNLTKNPLTFKDIDGSQASTHVGIPRNPVIGNTASEVHNVGEVWCMMLWEVRANLLAKYGDTIGNQLVLQLVTDGMKLAPANPNFVQARDAIIQADLVNNAGANKLELWAGFAKRGLGASATAPGSSTTTGVVEAFDLPDDLAITPIAGFTASGPVGGPFTPTSATFTLRNSGAATLNWTAAESAPWLNLSASGGSLAPGVSTTVVATLAPAATGLAAGIFNTSITFTNTTSGSVKTRAAALLVGQPDYFTELFETGTNNDTANQTFTFTPNTLADKYYVARQPATVFPSDTTVSSTLITLADDAFLAVTVTGGQSVKLYGTSYTTFYVGSNGYITFGSGDTEYIESFDAHFLKPRIAALFRDLNPSTGGTIRRRQFADRVAVTWLAVPEFGTANSNNLQIEMFFDGRITITVLGIASTKGLIGLSSGGGVPAGFMESNFSNYQPPALSVTLPASAAEGAGALTGQGTLTLSQPWTTSLTVALASSDPTAISVPASVVVPANARSVTFTPVVPEDGKITGNRNVTVTASLARWTSGSSNIAILDNENTNLTLTPANVTEGGTATGTVGISGTLPTNLTVALSSGTPARLGVPASVVIPAGFTSASFTETGVENTLTDGAASVQLTASATGFTAADGTATVFDNDVHHFTLSAIGGVQIRGLPFSVTINAVDVNGLLLAGFAGSVNLSASGGVGVSPASVALTAGTATVAVTASVYGTGVTLTASDGTTHTGTSNGFDVSFGALDHFGWAPIGLAQIRDVPFPVAVTALDVVGNTVANFAGSAALDAGTASDRSVPLVPASTGTFVAGVWSGAAAVGQIIDGITLRATSGVAVGESGVFNVGWPALAVAPGAAFGAAGPFGGPFAPSSQIYTLTNTGSGPLAWSVTANAAWLTLSASSGVLATGASATVNVGLDASSLEPGTVGGTVTFTNTSNGVGNTTRAATLTVRLPAPVLTTLPTFTGGTNSTLSWSTVFGAQTYEVQRSVDPSFAAPFSSGFIALTGHTFAGLGDGPQFYRVRARRIAGAETFTSLWSEVLTSQQSATGPAIVVTSPRITTQPSFTIVGQAFDPAGLQSLTVNGAPVSTTDAFAHWTLPGVLLSPGNNLFVVEAVNTAFAPSSSTMTWNVYLATLGNDIDHDGLPDAWESLGGLDLFDDTGLHGALGDLSGSGLPNLLKYAFGLDAHSSGLSVLPVVSIESDAGSTARYLTLRYHRLLTTGPLLYEIQLSPDLLAWSNAAGDFAELPPASPDAGGLTETVTIRILPALDAPGADPRYIRVHVFVP